MKILFTGFTSRTVGGDPTYDYLSNVFVLKRALELAGHTVDQRRVSLEHDAAIEEDYDCAIVGIAAVNGLSSRYKLGAMWTLDRFNQRAAVFPSDGRNVGVFPASVNTCRHIPRLLGEKMKERNNIIDHELGEHYTDTWTSVLERLPYTNHIRCAWKVLVPTFAWGRASAFGSHFGCEATAWDPTNVAWPMQFPGLKIIDGRPERFGFDSVRERQWVLSTLQDQDSWVKKQNFKWPIIEIGNKRKGLGYIPEDQMIAQYYAVSRGMIAFGYPLASGGWWRMRFVHAALAGCVTCTDERDQIVIGGPYDVSRIRLENATDESLDNTARGQYEYLFDRAWSVDRAVETVDAFVKGLVS